MSATQNAPSLAKGLVPSQSMYGERASGFDTIVWGGLVAGVLDAVDGVIAFAFNGFNPIQVLQYIASGALGAKAFQGGLATAALGAGFHFLIAFVAAAVYWAASLKMPALVRRHIPSGFAFGVAVYFFMNYLVLPMSNVPKTPFSLPMFLNGVIGHGLFVGLPIAWYAHRSARVG